METMKDRARWAYAAVVGGGMAWIVLVLASSAGLTAPGIFELLYLLAPLVIVPLGIALARDASTSGFMPSLLRAAVVLQPPAAALVVTSFWFPPGIAAAALVSAWVLLAGLLGLAGIDRFLRGGFRRADEACVVAGLLLLPVGAGGLLASRLGVSLLGFQEPIVFLTAVHFHYTGFAAPLIAGATGRALASFSPGVRALFRIVAAGVIAGPPLIATGFLFSPALQLVSVLFLSVSLVGLSALLIRVLATLRRRLTQVLLGVSAGSLVVGMLLAAVYAIGEYSGNPLISIPRMAWVHGTLNAIGFSLCGLLGWVLAARERATEVRSRWL